MGKNTEPTLKIIKTRTQTASFGDIEFAMEGDNRSLHFGNQAGGLANTDILYTDQRIYSEEGPLRIREFKATFPEYSREAMGYVDNPTSAYRVTWRDAQRVGQADPKSPDRPHRNTWIRVVRLSQVLREDGQPAISEEVVADTQQGYMALGETDEARNLAMVSASEAIFNALLMLEDVGHQFKEGTRSFSDEDQIDGWQRPPNDAKLLAAAMVKNTQAIYWSSPSPDGKEIIYGGMI